MPSPDYLNPCLPSNLMRFEIPCIVATPLNLQGYGELIDGPTARAVEIVRWPAGGWRPVDTDSGDEGGTKQGTFVAEWQGDVLYGCNEAVGGRYVLGYGQAPELATTEHSDDPSDLLLWHANYHPDGGQLFFPLENQPFLVPLALPGDDVHPSDFICFYFDGTQGLYIHPSIWHEGVFPLRGRQSFYDCQGAVHARVSVDFAREFECLLHVSLRDLEPNRD